MVSLAATLKSQFDFQTRLFNNVTSGISDNESQVRKLEYINNVKWVAGHMLNTRLDTMSKVLGLQQDNTYGAQFARGTVIDMNGTYPTIEEIKAKWNASAPAMSTSINNISAEALASTAPVQSPIFDIDNTIGAMLSFFLSHEAVHVGQLSLLRKMLDKEPMSFR